MNWCLSSQHDLACLFAGVGAFNLTPTRAAGGGAHSLCAVGSINALCVCPSFTIPFTTPITGGGRRGAWVSALDAESTNYTRCIQLWRANSRRLIINNKAALFNWRSMLAIKYEMPRAQTPAAIHFAASKFEIWRSRTDLFIPYFCFSYHTEQNSSEANIETLSPWYFKIKPTILESWPFINYLYLWKAVLSWCFGDLK